MDPVKEAMDNLSSMRTGVLTLYADRAIAFQLNQRSHMAEAAYKGLLFQGAATHGFCWIVNNLENDKVGRTFTARMDEQIHE